MRQCIKCGVADRNKRGDCRPCDRVGSHKYREANREKVADYRREWVESNREKVVEYQRKWHQANAEKTLEYSRKWREANPQKASNSVRNWQKENPENLANHQRKYREANPEKIKTTNHNRRARKKGNGGILSKNIVQNLLALQKGKCACCNKSLKDGYHLDHIMPIALGGKNTDDNVQLLTPTCNLRKSDKHPDDWARLNGRLI